MVKVDASIYCDLSTHEGFFVVGFKNRVLSRVRVENFLLRFHLSADVDVVNFSQVPFSVLPD